VPPSRIYVPSSIASQGRVLAQVGARTLSLLMGGHRGGQSNRANSSGDWRSLYYGCTQHGVREP
jgi:hypothetical protein